MNTVELARLVWAARSEASRLHRLAVESRRFEAQEHARLARMDARVYRCPGCGGWRYDGGSDRHGGARVTCAACGRRQPWRVAA